MSYHADRPRGFSVRAFLRRAENHVHDRIRPGTKLSGENINQRRQWNSKKRASHHALVLEARKMTGRARMGWKATKKFERRLNRRTKAGAR